MSQAKRATVYFEPTLHRALRLKAAETDVSVSDLVNEAVRFRLSEDAEDPGALRTVPAKKVRGRGGGVVSRLRGTADVKMSTDEILALTRKAR